jgi:hypothetical protein
MTDITTQLRARRVTRWVHGTGETPVAAGFAHDTLCGLAADEIERLREALQDVFIGIGQGGSAYEISQRTTPIIRAALRETK